MPKWGRSLARPHGYGRRNQRGQMLVNFLSQHAGTVLYEQFFMGKVSKEVDLEEP